jgi:hypothetical protein
MTLCAESAALIDSILIRQAVLSNRRAAGSVRLSGVGERRMASGELWRPGRESILESISQGILERILERPSQGPKDGRDLFVNQRPGYRVGQGPGSVLTAMGNGRPGKGPGQMVCHRPAQMAA